MLLKHSPFGKYLVFAIKLVKTTNYVYAVWGTKSHGDTAYTKPNSKPVGKLRELNRFSTKTLITKKVQPSGSWFLHMFFIITKCIYGKNFMSRRAGPSEIIFLCNYNLTMKKNIEMKRKHFFSLDNFKYFVFYMTKWYKA